MNLTNSISSSTNENSLEAKNSFDNNKLNINYRKHRSDNILPFIEFNKFNISLFNGINQKSDISNKSSISGKSLKLKNKKRIKPIEKLNSENIDEIISKKTKVFEALENLLRDDNDNDNNNDDNNDNDNDNDKDNFDNKNYKEKNDDIKFQKYDNNIQHISDILFLENKEQNNTNNIKMKLHKKCLLSVCVPKLDFSDIFNEYTTIPLYIQEVKYISKNQNKKKDKKKKKKNIDFN